MRFILMFLTATVSLTAPAYAHPDVGAAMSFGAGFHHPLTGPDHITAMVAVGLWAAIKGNRALWVWPSTFVAVMLIGGGLGLAHTPVPLVEPGILASIVILGLMVALAADPPVWVGAFVIGVFALLHGYAHGAELPETMNGLAFAAGFVFATAALHAIGIGLAFGFERATSASLNRVAGGFCVAIGACLWAGVL